MYIQRRRKGKKQIVWNWYTHSYLKYIPLYVKVFFTTLRLNQFYRNKYKDQQKLLVRNTKKNCLCQGTSEVSLSSDIIIHNILKVNWYLLLLFGGRIFHEYLHFKGAYVIFCCCVTHRYVCVCVCDVHIHTYSSPLSYILWSSEFVGLFYSRKKRYCVHFVCTSVHVSVSQNRKIFFNFWWAELIFVRLLE